MDKKFFKTLRQESSKIFNEFKSTAIDLIEVDDAPTSRFGKIIRATPDDEAKYYENLNKLNSSDENEVSYKISDGSEVTLYK